jgi:hypothetical protein
MQKIRITKTEVLEYSTSSCTDASVYRDNDVVNIDMAAGVDLKGLEENQWELADLGDEDDGPDTEWKAEIVTYDDKGNIVEEREYNEYNTVRDHHFPDPDAAFDSVRLEPLVDEDAHYDEPNFDGGTI